MSKIYKKDYSVRCLSGKFLEEDNIEPRRGCKFIVKSAKSDFIVRLNDGQYICITENISDINFVVNNNVISIEEFKKKYINNFKYIEVNLFFALSFKNDINDIKFYCIFDEKRRYMNISKIIKNNKLCISINNNQFNFKYIIISFNTIKQIVKFNNNKNNYINLNDFVKKRIELRQSFFEDPYFFSHIKELININLDYLIDYLLSIQKNVYFNILN